MEGVRRVVSHREERLRRRERVECVANFRRADSSRAVTRFLPSRHFPSTLSFLRERVWKIYLLREEEKGIGREWQTSLKWNEAAEKLLSSLSASKLPKLKLPLPLLLIPRRARKISWRKIKFSLLPQTFCSLFSIFPANESFSGTSSFSFRHFHFSTSAFQSETFPRRWIGKIAKVSSALSRGELFVCRSQREGEQNKGGYQI